MSIVEKDPIDGDFMACQPLLGYVIPKLVCFLSFINNYISWSNYSYLIFLIQIIQLYCIKYSYS